MPILTCCWAAAGTRVETSAKAAIRLRSSITQNLSIKFDRSATDYRSCAASGGARQQALAQPLTAGERRAQIKTVDDGKAKATGRHGVVLRRQVFVERDLHAGDARYRPDIVDQCRRRMPVAPPVRSEQ